MHILTLHSIAIGKAVARSSIINDDDMRLIFSVHALCIILKVEGLLQIVMNRVLFHLLVGARRLDNSPSFTVSSPASICIAYFGFL